MPEIEHKSDDFISFNSIKNLILDFFRFLFKAVDFVIAAIQRRLGVFLFCCALGIAAGYLYYWQNPNYYKTEMIVQSNSLSKRAYHEMVGNLDNLVSSQSYAALSSELKVDKQLTEDIISLEAVSLSDESLTADTSRRVGEAFKIQLSTRNKQSIPILQDAILDYVKSSPYLRLIKDGERKIYEEKLAFISREQKRLDSLLSAYHVVFSQMNMPSTFYNNAFDPAALYVQSLKLDSVREKTQKWLISESEPIFLIDGFKTPANSQSPSLLGSLAAGFSIGVLIGMFLVILSVLRKALKNPA